jgi:hypothetical protein
MNRKSKLHEDDKQSEDAIYEAVLSSSLKLLNFIFGMQRSFTVISFSEF